MFIDIINDKMVVCKSKLYRPGSKLRKKTSLVYDWHRISYIGNSLMPCIYIGRIYFPKDMDGKRFRFIAEEVK